MQKVGTSQRVETFDDTVMDEESNQGRMIAEKGKDDAIVIKDDKEEDKMLMMLLKRMKRLRVAVAPSRRRKGVIIRYPKEESTTSTIIPAKTKSKDKGKGILVEEPKPLKKKQQIEQDEQYARELHVELNKDIDWDEAIDHVKLKAKFNENIDFLLKTKEQIEEDENRALQTINETLADKAAMRWWKNSKDIFRLCLIKMMMSILKPLHLPEREDLEALWSLVKERFSTAKPKNSS
nr:hypothetical protein [Tanacetum cinerariifolium]